ncbi:MAG: hypothetical protein U0R51_10090 [Solirubrobacterales bacterium]
MSNGRLLAALLLAIAAVLASPAAASADRSFAPRFSANDTGDITFVANTLMTCPEGTLCSQARAGTATPISNLQNNAYAMTYVDVDSDSSTFDSSTSELSLPAGSLVLFAGLYWGGDYSGNGVNAAPNASRRDRVVFKAPGDSAYRNVTASVVDESSSSSGRYQAFADVTSVVAAAGNGTYAVGNVQAGKGSDHYAGWTLVIAYRDTTQPARNLTVFDGLVTVNSTGGATIPVSGFKTPPAGPVRTTLGFITYEGDLGIEGDGANLNGTPLTDAENPQTNFFNSTISNKGSRVTTKSPDYPNQLGIDSDLFSANGILANNATSANIQVTTSGDVYLPGVLTFATELFAPKIDQTKAVTDVNGGSVEPGDVLEYKVSGSNTGQDSAVGFTLRDPIPAGTTYVPGSLRVIDGAGAATGTRTDAAGDDNGEYDSAGNRIVARLGTGANATAGGKVAVGSAYDVRFKVVVGDRLAKGTEIVNTATSSFFSESLNNALTAASTVRSEVAAPDLSIRKTHSGAIVPGGTATYDLAVSNAGNAPIRGTTTKVTDTLPAGATPTSASGSGWSCAIAGQTVTCTRSDNLAAGASFPSVRIDAAIDPGAGPALDNTASVSNPADANPANDSSLDPAPTSPSADLAISKEASPGAVAVGGLTTFTIKVENRGPSTARNVSVLDALPTGLEYVSATASQGSCNATISCALGTVARNGTATVTVVARATAAGAGRTLRNTASVSGDQPDPVPGNDKANADVTVGGADLGITKTVSDEHPSAGSPLTYTIVVRNDGPSAATGVTVRDAIPAKLTGVGTDRGECAVVSGEIRCSFPALASGASESIHVSATVRADAAPGLLENTASVSGAEADPDPSDNSATARADVGASADLSLVKTADKAGAAAGEEVTYTLTAHNDGPSTAAGAKIVDHLPAGVAFVSASPGCTNASGTITCTLGDLASGADAVRTVKVRIEPAAVGTLTNKATVTATTTDPDPGDNDAATTTAIGDQGDLSLTKSVSPGDAEPGDVVTYTLRISNDGPASARDVVLSDTVPAGLSFVDSDPGAPSCAYASGVVSCELGDVPAGGSRTVLVRAKVDSIALPADHEHLLPVEKVEQQVDLEPGQVRRVTLDCPQPGEIMTDGAVRVDAVDQGTGTLGSVETRRSRSTAPGSYEFEVANTAGGRAQAKVFGTCMAGTTALEQGHRHSVLIGDAVSTTETLATGRHDVTVPCGPGTVAVAPGIDVSGGAARIAGSEPSGNGRTFTIDAAVDATTVELSVRCMSIRLDNAAGHTHDLRLNEVARTVTVPAGQTVSESAICADDAKGIVASYDLPAGLYLAGHDPQPKSRVFRIVNPTSGPLSAKIDLLCVGDRTSGPVATGTITNSANVSSPTPDADVDDRVASATLSVATTPPPPPPSGSGTVALDGDAAKLTAGKGAVAVPLTCTEASCEGDVTLAAAAGTAGIKAGKRLGRGTFRLDEGESSKWSVRLSRKAEKLAKRGKLRRVAVKVRYADGETVGGTLKLR